QAADCGDRAGQGPVHGAELCVEISEALLAYLQRIAKRSAVAEDVNDDLKVTVGHSLGDIRPDSPLVGSAPRLHTGLLIPTIAVIAFPGARLARLARLDLAMGLVHDGVELPASHPAPEVRCPVVVAAEGQDQ